MGGGRNLQKYREPNPCQARGSQVMFRLVHYSSLILWRYQHDASILYYLIQSYRLLWVITQQLSRNLISENFGQIQEYKNVTPGRTVQYSTVQYRIVKYGTVQYSIYSYLVISITRAWIHDYFVFSGRMNFPSSIRSTSLLNSKIFSKYFKIF